MNVSRAPEPGSGTADEPGTDPAADAAVRERRRRLAETLAASLLPETTSDERDPGSPPDASADDRWFTENRPPHHGG